jgi:hypothetical protein
MPEESPIAENRCPRCGSAAIECRRGNLGAGPSTWQRECSHTCRDCEHRESATLSGRWGPYEWETSEGDDPDTTPCPLCFPEANRDSS